MVRFLNPFRLFSKTKENTDIARKIYTSIVTQSRRPEFYNVLQVSDDKDGRLDLLMVHAFLVFHRFKNDNTELGQISQAVYDCMFKDIEQSMREMGIGDTGVAIRIKKISEGFHGRIGSYQSGLENTNTNHDLKAALKRNLYHKTDVTNEILELFCQYMQASALHLSELDRQKLKQGLIEFAEIPPDALKSRKAKP